MAWSTEGVITDPADDAILADSGALGVGVSQFGIIADIGGPSVLVIEHRNTANTANLSSQRLPMAYATVHFMMPFAPSLNERVRLRLETGFAGTAQGSIFT
jgi:hypothetical protein